MEKSNLAVGTHPERGVKNPVALLLPRRADLAWNAVICAAYVASAVLGFQLAFATQQVTAIWPPAGIALAAFLLRGPSAWFGVLVGALLSNALRQEPILTAFGISVGNTLGPLVGAYLVKQVKDFDFTLCRLRDVWAVAILGSAAMTITASNGVINLALGGIIPWHAWQSVWRTWLIGDAMGAVLIAPVILTCATNPKTSFSRWSAIELVLLSVAIATQAFFSFSAHMPHAYQLFPFVMWAALRFTQRETAISVLIISVFALWATIHNFGPFAEGSRDTQLENLVAFMGILSVTGLSLGALLSERRVAEMALRRANEELDIRVRERTAELAETNSALERQTDLLRHSEEQFRGAFETATHGMALLSLDGQCLKVNEALCHIVGYSEQELLGRNFQEITHPEDLARKSELLDQLFAGSIPNYQREKRYIQKDGGIIWVLLGVSLVRDASGKPVHFLSQIIDVTARHQTKQALRIARDEAEAANRAKSEFLATMSHEIRTPLNGILGLSTLLLDAPLSPDQRYRAQLIESAAKSLISIVNDVLDVSKIEAGKLSLDRVSLSPVAIADQAIAILRSQAELKGIQIRSEYAGDFPSWLEGDPARLRQILLNLLSNAIKFTDQGTVSLIMRRDRTSELPMLRVEVMDTGLGIAPEKQSLLFKDFSQIGSTAFNQLGSSGLGLSICRRLVEAMGGKIGVTGALGSGSTFWFSIPIKESQPPASESETSPNWRPKGSARILVAEDVLLNQIVIEGILRNAGHTVVVVDNGLRALKAVKAHKFDVILMDMQMPIMDGLAATRAIRKLDETVRGIPIIGLTAHAFESDRVACLAAGMNEHLGKPVEREVLLKAIARWLGQDPAAMCVQQDMDLSEPIISDVFLQELEEALGQDHVAALIDLFRANLEETMRVITSSNNAARIEEAAGLLVSLAGNLGCSELEARSRELLIATQIEGADREHLVRQTATAAQRARIAIDKRYPREECAPLRAKAT